MAADEGERDRVRERLVGLTPRSAHGSHLPSPRVSGGRAPAPGWVPAPPPGLSAARGAHALEPVGAVQPDRAVQPAGAVQPDRAAALDHAAPLDRDVAQDLRGRALASAITAYSAAHGHPLEHPSAGGERVDHRWATSGRVAVAAVMVLVVLCTAVVVRTLGHAPRSILEPSIDAAVTTQDAAAADGSPDPGQAPQPTAGPATVVVHVVGQVTRPGLVTLATGARAADAIDAAGGPTPEADLAALNLARVVTDGEQLFVPRPGEAPPVMSEGPAAAASGGSRTVDLNAADAAALDDLPGIGPVLAERIVDWRTEHGPFTTVDQLREVTGIGPAVLADIRDLVDV